MEDNRESADGLATGGAMDLGDDRRWAVLLAATAILLSMVVAMPAEALAGGKRVHWLQGFRAPGTPKELNKVGVLKVGPRHAPNILIFNPGTSAGSAYLAPFARTLVKESNGWQVWSVERRENLLEDQSVAQRAKDGKASPKRLFNYYLGWINDHDVKDHFQLIPDSDVEFAKKWGMAVEIKDLRKVVKAAKEQARHVVMMGHSRGGDITTAYATWDFNGKPGAKGLSGLVYDDGGSSPDAITAQEARQQLADLNESSASPWYSFGGIAAPFAGLFAEGGGTLAIIDPNAASAGQSSGLLPPALVPPFPVTNLAQWGYAADTETSPESLFAFQAHVGHLAASGDPRGWDQAGDITPIKRYARMYAGWGLKDVDGVAWYQPARWIIDGDGAVANGNKNPAQKVLGVRAIHGDDLPERLKIYAFGAFGGKRVLDAAKLLARQSQIPGRNLTLVDRHGGYAHNDPAGAFPKNAFLEHLVPFLDGIARPPRH